MFKTLLVWLLFEHNNNLFYGSGICVDDVHRLSGVLVMVQIGCIWVLGWGLASSVLLFRVVGESLCVYR